MTSSRLIAFAAALLVFIDAGARAQTPTGRFEKEIAAFEAADRAKPPKPGGIVFTGASGIRMGGRWRRISPDCR